MDANRGEIMSSHVHTLELHRFRLGELDPDEHSRVRSHLDGCDRCTERLAVQQAERKAFAARQLPSALLEAERPQPANRSMMRFFGPAALIVVAAAALVIATPFDTLAPLDPIVDEVRPKGDLPDLELWLNTDVGPRPLRAGERLATGDTVQMLFRPAGASWVTLAGKDGSGTLEVWGTAEPIGDHLQPAPFALTLDETAGPQHFFIVSFDSPLDASGVSSAIEGTLDGARVRELVVPKDG
jgi:hypothetical protein